MLFYFKQPIVPPPNCYMTVKARCAAVPVSFSLVNSSNNQLVVGSNTYTLTNGNYNALTLKTALQTLLSSVLTVSFNTVTNKFTFSGYAGGDFTVKKTSTCFTLLGFPSGSDVSSTGGSLTSTYSVDLSGDNVLHLSLDNLRFQNMASSTGQQTSILKSMLVDTAYGGVLFDSDTGSDGAIIQEDHIAFLHVRLLGEDQTTLIDMCNTDWSVTLEIGFVDKSTSLGPPALTRGHTPGLSSLNSTLESINNYLKSLGTQSLD